MFLATAAPSFAAAPGKRVALIIGNSEYKHKNAVDLPNAAGDAREIADKLKELGFEVDTGIDVDFDTFENMLYEFRDKIKAMGAEDVVFYYAGHGFQLDGRNHLVPVDARLTVREKIGYETVQLNRLIKQINADPRKQRTIVFLDACRDNPLPESVRGDDFENGLADVQMGKDGDNVLVIFSTRPGEVSQDGKDGNSPFAKSLLRHIATRDETVTDMMAAVSNDVYEATQTRQTPRVSGILRSKFYFNLKSSIVATLEPADEPAVEPPPASGSETSTSRALPASPSVELRSPDDAEPAAETPPQPSEIIVNPPEPPALAEPAPPAAETPPQSNDIAAKPPDLPATDAPISSAPVQNAEAAPDVTKPQPPVAAAAVPEQNQADNLAAVGSQPATPTIPEGTAIASLDTGETAQEPASASGQPIDPSPDRGIVVIRPSAASPTSGIPAAGKTLKVVQRASDGQPLRPSGERFEDDVALLTLPTENAEPPSPEPEKQEQPSLPQRVQEALSSIGCFAGNADGEWGEDSDAALARYLRAKDSGESAAGPTEEVLATLEQETRQVCLPEPEQLEPPASARKPDGAKKPATSRKPPAARPPTVRTPRVVRTPPVVKTPKVVRTPPAVKPPKVVKVPKKPPPKVAQKPKTPPPGKIVIPKIGGYSF